MNSGADAKQLAAEGSASVNGVLDLRRGKPLRDRDVLKVSGQARVALVP